MAMILLEREIRLPTVLVTGANRGLGLELARQYLADGWSVIAVCRRSSAELDAVDGPSLKILPTDLNDDRALAETACALGVRRIDVLINNAGTMGDSTFAESGMAMQSFGSFDRAEWHRVFDINVCTPMRIAELFVERMIEGGKIVTITSRLGSSALNTAGGLYAYRASKAAVNSIMKSMGIDLKQRGLIAIALHPGWVRTDMGGAAADIDVTASVSGMRRVIDGLTIADAGRFIAYDGSELPY